VALTEYVRSGHALPSQSDAGAHLKHELLHGRGVELGARRVGARPRAAEPGGPPSAAYTFQPARIMGLTDRGLIREGMAADLMVFDLARIGVRTTRFSARTARAGRRAGCAGAEGVSHVIATARSCSTTDATAAPSRGGSSAPGPALKRRGR